MLPPAARLRSNWKAKVPSPGPKGRPAPSVNVVGLPSRRLLRRIGQPDASTASGLEKGVMPMSVVPWETVSNEPFQVMVSPPAVPFTSQSW